ncbi:MAG: RNA 2',3'-cyclic phosphodiesterase [Bryobacterales bacterium]|nr:RNA 2',3'-cyclic phosphodiesterase [Bryobacterales bacterium]
MRLFTAIDISEDARAALTEFVARLRPVAPFRWSPPGNLHITTKFIGEWPQANLQTLCQALRGAAKPGSLEISIRGLGWFPNPHNPRVLFAGIAAGPGLKTLHQATDAACAAIGIAPEAKPYSPHLTLARIAGAEGVAAARGRIAGAPPAEFGLFTARAFHLYESVPGGGGSQYSKLEEFPLL